MRSTVSIAFGADEVVIPIPAGDADWDSLDARRWLDEQFTAWECEPLRASGKVLTADKVLAIATAVGARGFAADEKLRVDFARAAVAALSRPVVRVDVEGRAVSY